MIKRAENKGKIFKKYLKAMTQGKKPERILTDAEARKHPSKYSIIARILTVFPSCYSHSPSERSHVSFSLVFGLLDYLPESGKSSLSTWINL